MGKGMMAGKKAKERTAKPNMAQIQALQAQMLKAQEEVEKTETEASAGGGAVTVRVNGQHQLVSVTIKPELCDPEEVEMLQDLILTAANEAMRQSDEVSNSAMERLTGGMGLPF